MSDTEEIYVVPSSYDSNYTNYSNGNSHQKYRYYINTRTGEKVFSFTKGGNSLYEHIEACESQEKQENRGNEIKAMINYFQTKCNERIDNGDVVHVYLVVRQDKKYCGILSFVEIRKPDETDSEKFTRDIVAVTSSGTNENDADAADMPSKVLPMALTVFYDTLKLIANEPVLERYKGKKCYWVHIKHEMSAVYFTRELNFMEFFDYNSKNGGELKYTDTIKKTNEQLKLLDSFVKGDVDFYNKENRIDNDTLEIFEEYSVPDPDWLKKSKETPKFESKPLIGTNLSSLINRKKHKITEKDLPNSKQVFKKSKKK
jgi:hypothetical protein